MPPASATLSGDPRAIVDRAPMGRLQIIGIVLCVVLNALDGFDVLSIGFAAPGIARDWGIDRAALGFVLAMELVSMSVGSVMLGSLADRIGRRPVIIACLAVMALGMFLATTATGIATLSAFRLLTGLGIGGMLACTNAMVAELANAPRRSLCVAIMAAGFPMGGVLGGTVSSYLLAIGGWRDVFLFGAVWTAALLPFVIWSMPESIGWLAHRRPTDALTRINATLARMGHGAATALDAAPAEAKTPLAQLFGPGLARTTILMTLAYFCHLITFYFILKWTPKIVVDMGFAPSAAGGVLVWASVGGAAGALLLSALTLRFDVRKLVVGAMLLSVVALTLFGQSGPDLGHLALLAGIAGCCTNAAIVGMYAIVAQAFPAPVRAGGTGFVIGVGRGGSAFGPILAGLLFADGIGLHWVAALMALGSLLAAAMVWQVRPATA